MWVNLRHAKVQKMEDFQPYEEGWKYIAKVTADLVLLIDGSFLALGPDLDEKLEMINNTSGNVSNLTCRLHVSRELDSTSFTFSRSVDYAMLVYQSHYAKVRGRRRRRRRINILQSIPVTFTTYALFP